MPSFSLLQSMASGAQDFGTSCGLFLKFGWYWIPYMTLNNPYDAWFLTSAKYVEKRCHVRWPKNLYRKRKPGLSTGLPLFINIHIPPLQFNKLPDQQNTGNFSWHRHIKSFYSLLRRTAKHESPASRLRPLPVRGKYDPKMPPPGQRSGLYKVSAPAQLPSPPPS